MNVRTNPTWSIALGAVFFWSAAAGQELSQSGAPAIHRRQLENGVRLLIVHVPDAPKQAMFTFLPLGLAYDPPHRSQWSHLIEHMLIRSTDPRSLQPDGMMLNGETMPDLMRLETIAEPDRWRESIERHLKWITARDFDAETFAREKVNIGAEESNTAARQATHKFAVAAWNQVIRHGLDHAAVHGDIAAADINEFTTFVRDALPIDATVLIATVGPADPEAVMALIRSRFGTTPSVESRRGGPQPAADALARHSSATWDLPTNHVLVWWLLPDRSRATRAAGYATGLALQIRLMNQPVVKDQRLASQTIGFLDLPEGPVLLINTVIPVDLDPQEAIDTIKRRAAAFGNKMQGVQGLARMTALQWKTIPDFAAARKQAPPQWRDLVEAQWFLQRAATEYSWSAPMEDIARALETIDAAAIEALGTLLGAEPTGTLILRSPEDD